MREISSDTMRLNIAELPVIGGALRSTTAVLPPVAPVVAFAGAEIDSRVTRERATMNFFMRVSFSV
jgi:hypothetical protein